MDALTLAALCSLIVKQEAAPTAVPTGTDCPTLLASAAADAAEARRTVTSSSDREAIARVAWAEAANQGDLGLAAVVFTIINRLGSGRFGGSIEAVLNAPHQFEPVTRAGGSWQALQPVPAAARRRLDAVIEAALNGSLPDMTSGALYFQNAAIVAQRERAGQVSRGLTNFGGQPPVAVIGDHSFYGNRRAGQDDRRIAPSSSATNAYIEAGGWIFAGGSAVAFDTPAPVAPAAEVSQPRPGSSAAPPMPEPVTARPAQTEGMFVLANGQTSPAPH